MVELKMDTKETLIKFPFFFPLASSQMSTLLLVIINGYLTKSQKDHHIKKVTL